MGIESGEYSFPLLTADDEGLALILNEFSHPDVTDVFTPKMVFDWNAVPMQFVPVNSESAVWEIAEVVLPLVLELMHAGELRISTDQICHRMCTTWASIGRDGQEQLRMHVRRVFESAAQGEFAHFFQFQASGIGYLRIVNNPLELDTPKSAVAFRNLLKAQQQMLTRMMGGQLEIPF